METLRLHRKVWVNKGRENEYVHSPTCTMFLAIEGTALLCAALAGLGLGAVNCGH